MVDVIQSIDYCIRSSLDDAQKQLHIVNGDFLLREHEIQNGRLTVGQHSVEEKTIVKNMFFEIILDWDCIAGFEEPSAVVGNDKN